MTVDWFLLLLAIVAVIRGLGAGMICGVGLMTLPARKRIGVIPYARFARAHYKGGGVKAYAGTTLLGALLNLAAVVAALIRGESVAVGWAVTSSLLATILGFVGTAGAFPAMRELWQSKDEDENRLSELLDRFAQWHVFSAFWHAAAFIALIAALTLKAVL